MKDLSEVSIEDLKKEIRDRENAAHEEAATKLPVDYYPYKEIFTIPDIKDEGNSQLFYVYVHDGSEGFAYLVVLNHDLFDGTDNEDINIENSIRHLVLTEAKKGGYDCHIEDITVDELGRSSLSFLELTKPKKS